ncbi:MAG: tRNA 4-thiouridine(8) synthase ThiI [Methanoregula sp.]|nr:tRNA 4-thiouridine(8) synthase ThiI [Methanoregula sp.]
MKLVMVRYGELFLKSEPVKHHFIGLLLRNIGRALAASGLRYHFETPRGRIFIHGPEPEKIAAIARRCFGVVDVSVCTLTTGDIDALCENAVALASTHLRAPMSFAVRGKRQNKTGLTSQELGTVIGSAIYDHIPGLRVDLDHPDYEIFIEVRDIGGLIFDSRIEAPGGLPWGTQGKVLGLLSSGIDSPVASWLTMKRGCEVAHLHLDGGKWAGKDVGDAAIENHRRLSLWCPGNVMPLVIANSEPLYDEMSRLRIPPRLRCVICKRFMLRVGSRLLETEGAVALVTGENLGQVASQTLPNLAVISEAVTAPVIRPLITYDKEETIAIARKIGTFEMHPGDLACRAVPKMPTTAAILDAVKEAEAKIDIEALVARAVASVRYVNAENGVITNGS